MAARIVALALATTMVGGCVIRGRGRNVALGTDAALITAGTLLLASQEPCESGFEGLGCEITNDATTLIGAPLVLGGAIAFLATLALDANRPKEPQQNHESQALMLSVKHSTTTSFRPPQATDPSHGPCVAVVAKWRRELDLARRSLLYRDMSTACRRQISKPADAYAGPPGLATPR